MPLLPPQLITGSGGGGGDGAPSSSPSPPPHLSAAAKRVLYLLETCSSSSHVQQIQARVILQGLHRNSWVASAFAGACTSVRLLPSALLFVRHIPGRPHVYVCNTLMRALVHPPPRGSSDAFLLYAHMLGCSIRPNNYTFPLLLKSLSDLRLLERGRSVHAHVVRTGHGSDVYVQNSLLNLYSSCGEMDASEQVFDEMRVRDVVSWTTMIEGYRKAARLDEALIAFERMHFSGTAPNHVTMVNALAACAGHNALEMGVWIHDHIRRNRWELDVVLGTALVDMYGKCGRIQDSLAVFLGMVEKNVYTWNSLIQGLALAKGGEEALNWFSRMEKEGVEANAVTLIGVLCACSHSGLVDVGRMIFRKLLHGSYGFSPGIKHYGCMIDLLGRAGFLDEAVEFVEKMPFEPNPVVYGSLLGACRAHQDWKWSEYAAKKLVELEPENGAYHILLSNLYASVGRWSEVEEVRRLMTERPVKKDPGWVAGSLVH